MKNILPFFMMTVLIGALAAHSDAATRYAKANGNWNSNSTWTSTPSGTTSATYPVAGDIVVIGRNKTVTVNTATAACAALQIGSPYANGGEGMLSFKASSKLAVSGSVNLGGSYTSAMQAGNIDMTEGGTLSCASISSIGPADTWDPGKGTLELTDASTLPAQKITSFYNLTIKGTTTLATSITVSGTLTLSSGNLISAAVKLLTLGPDASIIGGGASSFVAGPMRITWKSATASKVFPVGKTTYEPITITLTTPSNPVIQAECFDARVNGTPASPLTALSTLHYYEASLINGTASKGGSVTLPNNADLATSASNLTVAQGVSPSGLFTRLTGNSGTATQVTSSGYNPATTAVLVLGSTDAAMPVELTSFTASPRKGGVVLSWATATEKNNAGFEIERRGASSGWQRLGFVEGSGTSNVQHQYSFTDAAAAAGTYTYRLKQIDRDGAFEYSGEVEASVALAADDYQIAQNYPNPFNPSTTIRFAVPTTQAVELKVFNVLGQEIRTLFSGMAEGGVMNTVQFDATGLPSGMYLYRISTAEKTEVKRMLLMR